MDMGRSKQSSDLPRNLILFITDQERAHDLNYSKGFDNDLAGTQWLKKNGLSFSNAFTNTNQCSVARSTFFTSKFPAQHQVFEVITSDNWPNPQTQAQSGLSKDLPNLATTLKAEGYDVVYKGKAHLTIGYNRTFGTADPSDDTYIDPNLSLYGFDEWDPPEAGTFSNPWGIVNPNEPEDSPYRENDQRFTDNAIQWIKDRQKSENDKPFALVVSLVNPHDVLAFPSPIDNTPPEFLARKLGYSKSDFKNKAFSAPQPIPETINNDPGSTYKPTVQSDFLELMNTLFAPTKKDDIKKYLNFYANLVKRSDRMLASLIDAVNSDKAFAKDTMIVKISDHGEMGLAQGGMRQKTFNAYEESIKIPTIWSNKHFFKGKGKDSSALISNIDFLPTYLNFIGTDPKTIDSYDLRGVDYSPILRGEKESVQDHILFTYDDDWAGQDPPSGLDHGITRDPQLGILNPPSKIQSLRSSQFKLVRYHNPSKPYHKQKYQEEFYDLRPNGTDFSKRSKQPLESLNYSPWAEAQRVKDGLEPISTRRISEAYAEMSKTLDDLVETQLQPLPKQSGTVPTYATRLTPEGKRVKMFEIHRKGKSSELELAFNSQREQYYVVQINETYLDSNGEPQKVWTNLGGGGAIKGTNNPIYVYHKGLPKDLRKSEVRVASVFSSSEEAALNQVEGKTKNRRKDRLINPVKTSAKQRHTEVQAFDSDCSGILRSEVSTSSALHGFADQTAALHGSERNIFEPIEEFGL